MKNELEMENQAKKFNRIYNIKDTSTSGRGENFQMEKYQGKDYKKEELNESLIRTIQARYKQLVNQIQDGEVILGKIEEKKQENCFQEKQKEEKNEKEETLHPPTPTPLKFSTLENSEKTILFKKPEKEPTAVLRHLEKENYLKLENIAQEVLQKQIYDKRKVIIIQKFFKGYSFRKINQTINRLKISQSTYEILVLLLMRAIYNAYLKFSFEKLKYEYFLPFCYINNEFSFYDKIRMKFPDKFYYNNNSEKLMENIDLADNDEDSEN